MQQFDLYSEFGNLLSSTEGAQALAALRQDTLVWQCLENAQIWQSAAAYAGNQLKRWTPGLLALLAVGCQQTPEDLAALPMVPLAQDLHEQALHAYQNNPIGETGFATFQNAAYLALALRERRRMTGSWNGFLAELQTRAGKGNCFPLVWRSAIACLMALIPDPEDLLRALLPRGGKTTFEWFTHAQLSQPVSSQERTRQLTYLLQGQPLTMQLGVLRSLMLRGRTELAESVADALLVGHPAFALLHTTSPIGDLDLPAIAARALTLQQMGTLYQLSGNRSQSQAMLKNVEQSLRHWLAGLYLQEMQLDSCDDQQALTDFVDEEKLSAVVRDGGNIKSELGAVITTQLCVGELTSQLEADYHDPFLQIKLASRLMQAGDTSVAQDLARQGVSELIETLAHTAQPFSGDFVYSWQPIPLLNALLDLGLMSEAMALGLALYDVRPTDTQLLQWLSQMAETKGDLPQAGMYAQAAVSLEPHLAVWRRRLGTLRVSLEDWQSAYNELEMVLALSNPPTLQDRLNYAFVALHTEAFSQVAEVCEVILSENPDHGKAAGMMGQALVGLGEREEAIIYLSRATLLAPDELAPWLTLARLQQEAGDTVRAIETLRAAVIASPQAVEGHVALSEACLEQGLLSDALPHLKQAFNLQPDSESISFLYGKTLHALGHSGDARSVLGRTRSHWVSSPEMAYEYALAALDQNDPQGAVPALEVALRSPQPPIEWHILFARVLLNEVGSVVAAKGLNDDVSSQDARSHQAEISLQQVMQAQPENYEARFLMANLHLDRNQLQEALTIYCDLSEVQSALPVDLRWRVQWGVGRTALRLGRIDTALVALQEASQSRPDCLELQRSLAEASLKAHLLQEAKAAAEYALQLAPDLVENLVWFADMMTALDVPTRAAEALESAIELDPQQAALRIGLAQLQLNAGNQEEAKQCLASLIDLPEVSSTAFRQAAHMHLRMDDNRTALECMENALQMDLQAQASVPMDVLFETSCLRDRMGQTDEALQLLQVALNDTTRSTGVESLPVYQMQGDLLMRLHREADALAAFEKALLIVPPANQTGEGLTPTLRETLSQIHDAAAHLLRAAGDLSSALTHAWQALDLDPDNVQLRYNAAHLAMMMLQIERAQDILSQKHLVTSADPNTVDLAALWIEMALFNGREYDARLQLATSLALVPAHPRLLAAQARLAAADGDMLQARALFEQVLAQTGTTSPALLWLAEAALSGERWQMAHKLFEDYLTDHPAEAMAYLSLARSMVLRAEGQRICERLNCVANAPGAAALNEAAYARFQSVVQGLEQRSSTAETHHWQARGQAAFQPTLQSARGLASYIHNADDAAALVAVMRQMKNLSAAQQTAHRYPQERQVQFQLGLAYLDEPVRDADVHVDDHGSSSLKEEGCQVAINLAAEYPGLPLVHALVAHLQQRADNEVAALDAFETALQLWPNESGWHEMAGDLALNQGFNEAALVHREQTVALDPSNMRAALKLGQVCLAQENVERAIEVLESATTYQQDQPAAWLTLAQAYQMAGRLPQALEAAMRVAEMEPSLARGFLLAGEASLAMGQVEQAIDLAHSSVVREPENPAAYLFLCKVYDLMDQPREALAALEEASPVVKQDFGVAFERARLIHDLHGPQQALEILERLAQEYPEEANLLASLARTQAECGDVVMAERHAFKALRLDPNQADLALMLGRLQRKSGQLDQSVHLLSEAVRLAPDQVDAYIELGSVYQDRREFDQALKTYHQAMRVAPRDYQSYYQSGIILRDNKDYAGSEQMLRQAAELAPDNSMIRRQLIAVITLNLVHKK